MKVSLMVTKSLTVLIAASLFAITLEVQGQETDANKPAATAKDNQTKDDSDSASPNSETKKLYEKFARQMSGSKLIGNFTMEGDDSGERRPEEYHILSAIKLDQGDQWTFVARIKYGGKDVTRPITLNVHWAGDTPVITVDKLMIPQMGTFDARVLINGNQYAGTWSHDGVGGHMFGTIEKLKPEEIRSRRKRKKDDETKSDSSSKSSDG